jgi:hypothetical protein
MTRAANVANNEWLERWRAKAGAGVIALLLTSPTTLITFILKILMF